MSKKDENSQTLEDSLNGIVKDLKDELKISEILKESLSVLLTETANSSFVNIANHGKVTAYFVKDKIPFYIEDIDSGPGFFCLEYNISEAEQRRINLQRGGSYEKFLIAYGDIAKKRFTLGMGSLMNVDEETQSYLAKNLYPALKGFFKRIGFKIAKQKEWGYIHGSII